MLACLIGSTRPDLAMKVHQAAHFSIDPKLSHEKAVIRIGRCLASTSNYGMFYKLCKSRCIEVFLDADFAGSWAAENSLDPNSVLSKTGHVICIFGFPLHWQSKLKTEIVLSTTEADYVALSQSLRNVMPLTNLTC